MDNTKKIIGGVVVAVVVIIIGVVWYMHPGNNGGVGTSGSPSETGSSAAGTSATSSTHTALPANVVAPNKGATNTPAGVAVPVVQAAGDPAGNIDYRSFNITVNGGVFSPDTVIVKQGDTVNLEITAQDAAYGFTQPDYGFSTPIAQGKTQTIQFQALQSGNFTFYCASCGGPSKGPVGHLLVTPK